MATEDVRVPVPPDGVRPGQLGVIALGRVILGDIAVTLVDLANRELARIEPATDADGGWQVGSLAKSAPRHRRDSMLEYEEVLLEGLPGGGSTLPALASALPHTLDKTRSAMVHDAVHRGWLKRLHHDERTEEGEALAAHVRAFRRDLRRLNNAVGADALTGQLLPYAVRCALAQPDLSPLVQFAHDFAATFAGLPGWQPPEHRRPDDDDEFHLDNSRMPTASNLAWLL